MFDPIADMLTKIRNALATRKREVVFPYSEVKFGIAKILEKEGYLSRVKVFDPNLLPQRKVGQRFKKIKLILKYDEEKKPRIKGLRQISKPGRHIYTKKEKLPRVLDGLGMAIISTSQGLLTDREARKRGLGGEVICEIW